MIAALLIIAVFAPFLASSFPIAMKSSEPVTAGITGATVFEPGLSFPLLHALSSVDLLLLLAFGATVAGAGLYVALARSRRFARKAPAVSAGSVAAAFLVLPVLIPMVHESRRALLVQVDFHDLEETLGEDEWSIWPPVRYGPEYIDRRVPSWLRPPWLELDASEKAMARRRGGENWESRVRSHLLGTEMNRKDVLSLMIHGTRISLGVGLVAVSIYVVIGVLVGALAGFYGGWVDVFIMRFIEIVTCFPTLVLVVAIAAVFPASLYLVMAVISLVSWPFVARLVRAEFLRLRGQEFVQAAIALGASDRRVIFRHILPNALAPVLVAATFGVAAAILVESALSFLGIGVPVDSSTWGNLLRTGSRYPQLWWVSLFPGLAILVTIVSCNLVGEALRDAFDPKQAKGAAMVRRT